MLIHKLKSLWQNFTEPKLRAPKDKNEVINLLRRSEEKLILNPNTLSIIESVLQASDMHVEEIMIPKAQAITINKDSSLYDILNIAIECNHSRFPILTENKDEVVGVLLAKDLLCFHHDNSEKFDLADLTRPTIIVPESQKIYALLNEFQKTHNHLAVVVDEYGKFSGIITIEDILEQIVGEIEDEHDIDEELNILKHEHDKFSVKAITPIEEFNEYFNTYYDDSEVDTIGGLITRQFNKIPSRNETITIGDLSFTILRADKRKIHLLRVTRQ